MTVSSPSPALTTRTRRQGRDETVERIQERDPLLQGVGIVGVVDDVEIVDRMLPPNAKLPTALPAMVRLSSSSMRMFCRTTRVSPMPSRGDGDIGPSLGQDHVVRCQPDADEPDTIEAPP